MALQSSYLLISFLEGREILLACDSWSVYSLLLTAAACNAFHLMWRSAWLKCGMLCVHPVGYRHVSIGWVQRVASIRHIVSAIALDLIKADA